MSILTTGRYLFLIATTLLYRKLFNMQLKMNKNGEFQSFDVLFSKGCPLNSFVTIWLV